MATGTTSTGAAVARRLIDAIAERDFESMSEILAPDLWMRALLPREIVETHTADAAIDSFRRWLAPHESLTAVMTDQHTVEGREFVAYKLLLRPEWAADEWHVLEQSGYCRVVEDRVTRLDLVCTGFFPAGGEMA
jgi:hypothetical protein